MQLHPLCVSRRKSQKRSFSSSRSCYFLPLSPTPVFTLRALTVPTSAEPSLPLLHRLSPYLFPRCPRAHEYPLRLRTASTNPPPAFRGYGVQGGHGVRARTRTPHRAPRTSPLPHLTLPLAELGSQLLSHAPLVETPRVSLSFRCFPFFLSFFLLFFLGCCNATLSSSQPRLPERSRV